MINEDVMQKIWDISRIPLPLTDMIGTDNADNSYTEWTEDKLSDPDTANAKVDGQDLTGNDAKGGARIGNHCQISTKNVSVTERAQSSDTVGRANELSYQVMMRQRELRRDVEAITMTNQGSQADNGDTTPGKAAGLGAMITQGDRPSDATGGGFSNGAWTAYTPGTKRALTETMVRDVAQLVWEAGGDPSVIMSTPTMIRQLSSFMFTDSARIATLTAETNQNGPATAMGSVNVFLTDFGVELKMVPNRLQQTHDSLGGTTGDACHAYVIDPAYMRHGHLKGYRTEPLAKTGLADKRSMAIDWTTKVLNREAHGIIADLDYTAAVTA
ncbi:SU10 major capsid protein [Primorskyibacter sp. S87]|uniref:SU10 major capsid protein n=1 Tax=Primorskyibacter sp. S87 TaxID=3415126 RepID=UPI003C7CF256